MKGKFTEEELFCIKYLYENGRIPKDILTQKEVEGILDGFSANYKFVKVNNDFFTTLAEKLRELWPVGEKDGKYPWRDSVPNLTKRLKALWDIRGLKDYTIDECLTIARRYLSQFENNAKYMKTLKYFILRQNENVIGKDGKIHYINNSIFADMLEGQPVEDEEWASILSDDNMFEVV